MSELTVIGKPVTRVDANEKVTGQIVYGYDLTLPNMLYGKTLLPQNGAPIRVVVPWKYGFKSIKSIVEIRFTERQPPTSWNISSPGEYGFYANVNPEVDHPRWSQARERRLPQPPHLARQREPPQRPGQQPRRRAVPP